MGGDWTCHETDQLLESAYNSSKKLNTDPGGNGYTDLLAGYISHADAVTL